VQRRKEDWYCLVGVEDERERDRERREHKVN